MQYYRKFHKIGHGINDIAHTIRYIGNKNNCGIAYVYCYSWLTIIIIYMVGIMQVV